MEIRKQKRIPLACRYVPYDQWFLTHVDSTWKIKHLKQLILAKCFSLPFDPRRLGSGVKDADGSRAASPITFAPDEGQRPISPIKFANPQELRKKKSAPSNSNAAKEDEDNVGNDDGAEEVPEQEPGKEAGYEEDDEWDEDEEEDEDDDDELPSPVFPGGRVVTGAGGLATASGRIGAFRPSSTHTAPFQADSHSSAHDSPKPTKRKRRFNPLSKIGAKDRRQPITSTSQEHRHQEEGGIQTTWFTLLRFTTGQVLEDDFPLSWYDLMPHELVEMHNSVPPASFAVSAALNQLLLQTPNPNKPEVHSRPQHAHSHSYSHSGGLVKSGIITTSADAASALASALLIPTSSTSSAPAPVTPPLYPPHSANPLTLHQTLLQTQYALLDTQPVTLTALPRTDPVAYGHPYWEGWVRTLRTVWRTEPAPLSESLGPGGRGRFEYPEYSGGMVGGGGVGLVAWEAAFGGIEGGVAPGERVRVKGGKDGKGKEGYKDGADAGGEKEGKEKAQLGWREVRDRERGYEPRHKSTTTLEWRERWVVIKDGVIYIYKERGAEQPTHRMPLGAIVHLCGAEHLAQSVHSQANQRTQSTDHPRHKSTARPQEHHRHHRRSASQPRAGSNRDPSRKDKLLPHQSPGPSSHPKNTAAIEEITRDPAERNLSRPPGLSTPSTSFERRSQGSVQQQKPPRQPTEAELRTAKEREARQEQEKIKEMERRRIKEKQERELENLRRWDDIGLSFPFGGKSKDKDKDKGKGKGKGKERSKDDKRRAGSEQASKETEREEEKERERLAREKERERAKEREKEKERERERRKREHVKEQERLRQNPRTYVPTSRDEAEAAGMKVICAKFQSTRSWQREQLKREKLKAVADAAHAPSRRYTSTGPSLAGTSSVPSHVVIEDTHYDSSGGTLKDKHPLGGQQAQIHGHVHSQSLTPRKASLPGLGLSAKSAATASLSMTSFATTGTPSSLGRNDSMAANTSKFGIGTFFGKDKDATDDVSRKEKDEKRREEKERKAREKEQKQIEKDKKKGKRREDDDDDDFGGGSALSWTLGKKTKPGSEVTSSAPPVDTQDNPKMQSVLSLSTADTSTLNNDNETKLAASAATIHRPKLTISPSATPEDSVNDVTAKADSDSESSMSVSSPVFAHSTDSDGSYDEDDIHGHGRPRQGYRYGGYHPPSSKAGQKPIQSASVMEANVNKSEASYNHLPVPTGVGVDSESMKFDKASDHSRPPGHRSNEKEKGKAKGEDRGEWIVLDMGSDQAFHSILRIFHRHFSNPMTSDFLPSSVSAPVLDPSATPKSESPTQRTFWSASSSALDHGADNGSTATENIPTLVSSSSHTSAANSAEAGSDADGDLDSMYASTAAESSSQRPSQQPHPVAVHPHIRTTLVAKPSHQTTALTPALPYPEWRTEVVHRARRYGMREAGRPLELALYGWGRYFVDMETSAVYQKLRKKEETTRQKVRDSILVFSQRTKLSSAPRVRDQDDTEREEVDVSMEGEEGAWEDDGKMSRRWEGIESSRRMSTASHVSTIKAPAPNFESSTNGTTNERISEHDAVGTENTPRDTEMGSERGSDGNDTDSVASFRDDEFEGGYAYGQDDEVGALVEGLGSIVDDSDEESEVEWFAWTTDLPRQYMVRQEQLEHDRHENEKAQEEQEVQEPESQPLSPMEFSNPFSADNASFISQNITLPTVLPPIPPPKTPEEERRQYTERRRKLEPSAVSTSLPPPVPPLPVPPRITSLHSPSHQPSSSGSSIQSTLPSRATSNVNQGGHHSQHYPSALSSPSSSESLGRVRQPLVRTPTSAIPINIGLANSSKNHSTPMSPLGTRFSPIDDEEFYSPSMSTTPPSATVQSHGFPAHRRTHSQSISGSIPGKVVKSCPLSAMLSHAASHFVDNEEYVSDMGPGRGTLHHSTSMPHTSSADSRAIFSSSSPHSPTRSSAAKGLTQPISMPILSPAQISQIESEMEEMMVQRAHLRHSQNDMISLLPSPSVSPPSSYGHFSPREPSTTHGTIARRSSSAGIAPSTPPPSSSSMAAPIGRSASVRQKAIIGQPPERPPEKGLLRKKRSDLGKNASGNEPGRENETNSPAAKQRPALSLLGLSSNNSKTHIPLVEAQSPTQQRHPRGPRSAHPQTHDHGHGAPATPPSTSYQSAKALLRRVRSGSSLRMDRHIEEVSPYSASGHVAWPINSPPPSGVITNAEAVNQGGSSNASRPRDASPPPKKKIGTIDRIVRGFDSALEFVDGR